ncbi:MAG: hypothetical protein ACYC5M_06175 [Anaerolineae bacterium]
MTIGRYSARKQMLVLSLLVTLTISGCTGADSQAGNPPSGTATASAATATLASGPVVTATPTVPAPTNTPPPTVLPSPTASPTAEPTNTPRPTSTPTSTATPTVAPATATPTTPPSPTARPGSAFEVGGIDFADMTRRLGIRYPSDLDRQNHHDLPGVDVLVSDGEGKSIALFYAIGQWGGVPKIFVYPDTLSGMPVLSIHDGTYRQQPMEAEPLRAMLEGNLYSTYPLETIQENLVRVRGAVFAFTQGDVRSEFVVKQAIRMDAITTESYRYRAGELSGLFDSIENPAESILILICSGRQPDEPNEHFPGRFVFLLEHTR